jgi:hypothetical protein
MNSLLYITVGLIIIGMLTLMLVQMDSTVKIHSTFMVHAMANNGNLNVISRIMEFDLRKIGHGLRAPLRAIHIADSARILFSYDQKPFSLFDSIRVDYQLSDNTVTPNPRDKLLTRTVNGNSQTRISMGVTRMRFRYYNQAGTELAVPVVADSLLKIKSIRLLLAIQNTEAVQNKYVTAYYSSQISPKNLLVRYGR